MKTTLFDDNKMKSDLTITSYTTCDEKTDQESNWRRITKQTALELEGDKVLN